MTKSKATHEIVVDEGDGLELVQEGTEAELLKAIDELRAEHTEGEAYAGYPIPDYRIQLIDWTRE